MGSVQTVGGASAGRGKRIPANANVFAEYANDREEGQKHYPLPERAANADVKNKRGNMGTFNDKCARKGYTVVDIFLRYREIYGYPSSISRFREAVKDKPFKSKREEFITEESEKILDGLPDLIANGTLAGSFAKRARARGVTVRDVWERYNATRVPKYTFESFKVGIIHPTIPSTLRLLAEADKCLDELTNQRP